MLRKAEVRRGQERTIDLIYKKQAEIHGQISAQIAQAKHDFAHVYVTIQMFTDAACMSISTISAKPIRRARRVQQCKAMSTPGRLCAPSVRGLALGYHQLAYRDNA